MSRDVSELWWKHGLYLGACWLLGGLFIYAGLLKANDSQAFADNIVAYQLLPELLITGWKRRLGTLAILFALARDAVVVASTPLKT